MASPATTLLDGLKAFIRAEGLAGRLVPAPGYIGQLPPALAQTQYPLITMRFSNIETDGGDVKAEGSLIITVLMEAANPETCHSIINDYADVLRRAIKRHGSRSAGLRGLKWSGTRFNAIRTGKDTAAIEVAELEYDCKFKQEDQQP